MNKYTNCVDCPAHEVINDKDPDDWFCDNDVAIVCKHTPNPTKNVNSRYSADHSDFRAVTVACRLHYIRKESTVPDWCPLKQKE